MTIEIPHDIEPMAYIRARQEDLSMEGYVRYLIVLDFQRHDPDPPRQHPNPGRRKEHKAPALRGAWLK